MNRDDLIRIITGFDWGNYGLDEVGLAESVEWAEALADKILAAGRGDE